MSFIKGRHLLVSKTGDDSPTFTDDGKMIVYDVESK